MFANKYYKHDIKYTFQMNRFFFRIIGVWPFARANPFLPEMIETALLVFICMALLLAAFIPAILYVILVLKNMRLRLKAMGCAIFALIATIKYSYILLYKRQIRRCLMMVDEDWRNVANPNMRVLMIDKVKTGRRLLVLCAITVYSTGLAIRVLIPISVGKIITPLNTTIRPLPCAAHFIVFDVQRSPAYEIVFFLHIVAGFVKYTITVATFGFITLCSMHFCAQLDILVTLINNLVNERKLENLNKRLAVLVEHQIKTRTFLQSVQSATQFVSLIEVLGSTLMVCITGYYVIMEWQEHNIVRLFSYMLALVMLTFNVFIYCYMGEQVVEQGEKVILRACTLEWYHLPYSQARALVLVMAISKTPLKIKAGKFIDLSLTTFGNVVKMAVTYLNLLRSFE